MVYELPFLLDDFTALESAISQNILKFHHDKSSCLNKLLAGMKIFAITKQKLD
ncbi:MAG: hypothetical protein AAGM29_16095 [Cyanobacteria bacterium J06588_4]